jgi:hypothetical protein
MTIQLTSVQEAALNAAGEAMQDIETPFYIGICNHRDGQPFGCWADHPNERMGSVWGYGATMAEATQDMLRKLDAIAKEPPKLKTAAEAVEAMRGLLKEEDPLRAKLDELPIA